MQGTLLARCAPMRALVAPAVLLACGLLLVLLDLLLVRRFPLFHALPPPGTDSGTAGVRAIFGSEWPHTVRWYVVVVSLQFLLYAVALLAVRQLSGPRGWLMAVVFGPPVLFAGVLLFLYPVMAVDLFHYLAAARIFWVWGDNPLVVPHGTYPFPMALNYTDLPSPYGPLWTLLTFPAGLLSRMDGEDLRPGLLGLKLVAAAAYVACAWLIYATLRQLAPARALLGVVAFAWNPFVVFRVVGNGHNELAMLVFVLLAAYLVTTERWVWVMPALAAAVLVKYIPLLLVPPLLVSVIRLCRTRGDWRPLRGVVVGTCFAAVASVIVWLPFWHGPETFAICDELDRMYAFTSTPGVLAYHLAAWFDPDDPGARARHLTALAFGTLYIGLLWRVRGAPEGLFAVWYLSCFAALVVALPIVRPWYFLWFVTVGALLPGRGYLVLGAIASASASVVDLVERFVSTIPWVQDTLGRMLLAPVVVQFLPAVVCLLVLLRSNRSLLLVRERPQAGTRPVAAATGSPGT